MAVERVRCPCRANPECKLCGGSNYYDYEVGPRGWLPFTCPTCGGSRVMPGAAADAPPRQCVTCRGEGHVDPANPPQLETTGGFLRMIWRVFFGG
jgi:hypothetical protein